MSAALNLRPAAASLIMAIKVGGHSNSPTNGKMGTERSARGMRQHERLVSSHLTYVTTTASQHMCPIMSMIDANLPFSTIAQLGSLLPFVYAQRSNQSARNVCSCVCDAGLNSCPILRLFVWLVGGCCVSALAQMCRPCSGSRRNDSAHWHRRVLLSRDTD